MIRQASYLVFLIAFATAILSAQETQAPGSASDRSDPAASSVGAQSGAQSDSDQMKQSGQPADSDRVEKSSQSSSETTVRHSESSTSQSSSSSKRQAGQTALHGTIQKVDSIGNNVTIQTDNNEQETLSMDASTKIHMNGQAATVADLKPGQRVDITMDGQKAVSVDVTESSSRIK